MGELDIKSSTIDKSLDAVKGFLQKLVGPSVDEMGLLLSDNVKMWRLKNQIRNIEKVKAIVEKQKINVKQVNLKVLFPYLEGVSLEDDEGLQNLWANLLVNYIDADKNLLAVVYPSVLKQLSSDEVKILQHIHSTGEYNTGEGFSEKTLGIESKNEWIANMERLQLVAEFKISTHGGPSLGTGSYYLSKFGAEFMKACKR